MHGRLCSRPPRCRGGELGVLPTTSRLEDMAPVMNKMHPRRAGVCLARSYFAPALRQRWQRSLPGLALVVRDALAMTPLCVGLQTAWESWGSARGSATAKGLAREGGSIQNHACVRRSHFVCPHGTCRSASLRRGVLHAGEAPALVKGVLLPRAAAPSKLDHSRPTAFSGNAECQGTLRYAGDFGQNASYE
jgi:hypothetical protein